MEMFNRDAVLFKAKISHVKATNACKLCLERSRRNGLMILLLFPYTGVLVEQYLMLNRRNSAMDKGHVNHEKLSRDAALFMCTTMYHEADYEMEQLLHSIGNLDRNRHLVGRHLESHIFFDGCLQGEVMNEYVLTLCALLEKTLRIKLANVVKMKTPYGMQMRWKLPGGTDFTIHLKDNKKVRIVFCFWYYILLLFNIQTLHSSHCIIHKV